MRTAYFLNGVEVSKPTMVKIGLRRCIINPTYEHLIEAGYEIREVEYEEVSYKPTYEERVELELYYIDNQSLKLDIICFFNKN